MVLVLVLVVSAVVVPVVSAVVVLVPVSVVPVLVLVAVVETSPIVSIVVMPVVVGLVVPVVPVVPVVGVSPLLSPLVPVVLVPPGSLAQATAAIASSSAARASTGTRGREDRRMPSGIARPGRLSRVAAGPVGCGRVAATMRAYLSILVALMMAACGEPPAPAKPAPTKAAAPVAAPVAPPAEPHGRVFMIASEAGLAPVACHLAHVPKFSQGDECLALLKTGSNARLESGQVSRITGVGKADCGEGQAALVEAPPGTLRGHATAPVETDFVEVIPPVTPAEADKAAPEPLRARLREALAREFPDLAAAKPLQVRQVAQIDLDADGKPETLVVVAVPAADPDAPPSFSGLYVVPEGEVPVRKLKGEPGSGVQYMLLGALDLDADGRPELWLNTYDDDGFAWSVEQLGSVELTELGRRRCEA